MWVKEKPKSFNNKTCSISRQLKLSTVFTKPLCFGYYFVLATQMYTF